MTRYWQEPSWPEMTHSIDPQGGSAAPDSVSGRAVHASFDAIVTVDERQKIVMLNPAAQRMFRCTADEVLGTDLSRFIPAQHREAHAAHVRAFGQSESDELPMGRRGTIIGVRADGEEFPAQATICKVDIREDEGTRRYYTALIRDLSRERDLEHEIGALRRHMRDVFEMAPVAIWITEGDRVVFANRSCVDLFGARRSEELVGRLIYDLLPPESHPTVRQRVTQALSTSIPIPAVNERIVRLDGTTRDVVIAVAPLPDHGATALQMVITDITERAQHSQELERSRRELRRLSANLVHAREEEQRRIARELHDELGQRLTALKMELSSLIALSDRRAAAKRVTAMLEMVDETVASVRRIATELRPLMLDDLGLNAAIEWLARSWEQRMGVAVSLRLDKIDERLSDAAAIAVYRMVQEALTNIARHAQATRARIEIREQGGELVLTVQDNGKGFSEPSVYREGSHGLMGIRERAYMLGGSLEFGNGSGEGGRIRVRLPLLSAKASPGNPGNVD